MSRAFVPVYMLSEYPTHVSLRFELCNELK